MKLRGVFALLVLAPLTALAAPTYQDGETIGTNAMYGEGAMCDGGTTSKVIACDPTGKVQVTLSGGFAATFAAADATLSAAIGAAYASAVDLPDDTKAVILDNQTNGDVWVSMDGGVTDTFHIRAGDVLSLNLAASGLKTTADVQLKDGTTASTTGTFYVYSYK